MNWTFHFILVIGIDSVMKIDKKNYPQVYLEEWKYGIKKKKMTKFIDIELNLDDCDNSNDSDDSNDAGGFNSK